MDVGYAILSEINPRLIYVSVSCYGPRGAQSDSGGFDYQGQARAGTMYAMESAALLPLVAHFGMIDQVTAITNSQATLAALVMRERTGRRQLVETSMLGGALNLAHLNFLYSVLFQADMPRHDRTDTDPWRNYYQGSDGKGFMLTMMSVEHWASFCQAVGHPELLTDPCFDTEEKTAEIHSKALIALLDGTFASSEETV